MTEATLNRIKEKIVGMTFKDYDGVWEITDVGKYIANIRQVKEGSRNYGRNARIGLETLKDILEDRYPQQIEDEAKEKLIGKAYRDEDGIWEVVEIEEDYAQVMQIKVGAKDFGRRYDVLVDEVEGYVENSDVE